MIETIKNMMTTPTPLELAAGELVKAQREKLEAESALDYATHMVMYHDARIKRLHDRVDELKGEYA